MAGDWFFLSYARLDRDDDPFEPVRKFYDDLDRVLRKRKAIHSGTAGFYDGTGIQQGDHWPSSLGTALNSCRTLVCLYSQSYFVSEYCGKELAVFKSRVANFINQSPAGTVVPRLIVPVLLYPKQDLEPLPAALKDIQYFDDTYPEIYREEGLIYLLRRTNPELQNQYQDLLDTLVDHIVDVTRQANLPSLAALPDIKTLQSAFDLPPAQGVPKNEVSGPRYAEFIYVAGTRDEIQPLGRCVDNYGTEGELDWKPYLPESADEIGLIAQSAATREGFRYERIALDNNLLNFISDAENKNRIVIIIVDTWTLTLARYKQWMQEYDRRNFTNCAALVVWNEKDNDTVNNRQNLEFAVRYTFLNKARFKDPNSFIDNITSSIELTNSLSVALQKVSLQIIEANTLRRIDLPQMIGKPEISGPGAART